MADRKQGAGLSSGSSAVHKANSLEAEIKKSMNNLINKAVRNSRQFTFHV